MGESWELSFFGHSSTLASESLEWHRGIMAVHTKRIYEESSDEDGCRVLVDRIWPRGVSKQKSDLDEWLKEIVRVHEAIPSRTWEES